MNDWIPLFVGLALGALLTLAILKLSEARKSPGSKPVAEPRQIRRAPRPPPLRPEDIIERTSEGVLVLDERLRPSFANSAARTMLGIRGSEPVERVPSEEISALAVRALAEQSDVEEIVGLWYPSRSSLNALVSPLPAGGALVLLRDVTEEVLSQRIRREFVAHASHELKSPVAGLQTLAEAVRRAVEDDQAAATRFADRLATEAARLGRLVADLLDLSRLEDPTGMPLEPADLSEIARTEFAELASAASAKDMELIERIGTDVWVRGDDEQIALMLRNILENAVRYTPDGGSVNLEVEEREDWGVIAVRDTGIGIPREAQGRIFERFYRVDRARSRDRGGTGLGLAIVKHVAELHGGRVTVESNLGEGSTFTVFLPLLEKNEISGRIAAI
jgi:signal transduction histidine kinase